MIQAAHGGEISRRHEQSLDHRTEPDAHQQGIDANKRPQPFRRREPKQTSHVSGSQDSLDLQQQIVAPRTKVITVPAVQRLGALAVHQVPAQVDFAIDQPLAIRKGQIRNPKARADPVKHIIKFALFFGTQRSGEQFTRSLGIIDEHVEHVAVRPIGHGLPTLAFDGSVNGPDPLKR